MFRGRCFLVLVPVLAGNQNLRLHKKVNFNFGRSMVNAVTSDQSRKDDLGLSPLYGKHRTYRAFVPGS